MKVAKRSGFLSQAENFFGVFQQPRLIDDECDKARCLYHAINKKSSTISITIYGELFGGMELFFFCFFFEVMVRNPEAELERGSYLKHIHLESP